MKFWKGCVILVMMGCLKVQAQFPILNFSKISVEQGLSNRVVNTLYQDKDGFVWAGTNDGINRLDGYRIKQFYYVPDILGGIPNNSIHQITGKQKMLVSTESGIACFGDQHQFSASPITYRFSKTFNANIFEDENDIWVCASDSLFVYKNNIVKTIEINYDNAYTNYKKNKHLYPAGITKDAAGNYWAWKGDALFLLSLKDKKVLKTFFVKTHSHEGINFVKQDVLDKEILWIGTWGNGLFKFNINSNTIQLTGLDKTVVHDIVNYKDVSGKQWMIAATNKGISLIHPRNYNTYTYNIGECFKSLVDTQGNLWLGTANGIYYVEPQKQWFNITYLSKTIDAIKNENLLYLPNTLSYVNGKYYSGIIYARGMAVYDAGFKMEKYIPNLFFNKENYYFKDIGQALFYNNSYWFSCDSGLVKCNGNYAVQKIVTPPKVPNAARTSYFKIRKIIQVNDSLFLAKSPSAIHLFNVKTERFEKTFTHQYHYNQSLPDIYFSDIAFIKNECFITTDDGLLRLNYFTGKWSWINKTFANSRMQCIAARDSLLWIGTQTGLSCLNIYTNQLYNYYRSNGLSSDNILNICTDNKQRVWIATANGLTCFEKNINNFTRIYKENGLPENALEGLLFADEQGKVFVGSIDAVTWFYADNVLQKKQEIKAVINELFCNNQPVHWQIQRSQKYIEVTSDNNNISLHFALLNYNNKSLNKYYYLLEGADEKWHENSSGFLQFSNLKSGKYKLYVSAIPQKNSGMDVLYISIKYPFYQTWWFITLIFILIAAIFLFFFRIKAKALQEKLVLQKNYNQQIKEAEMQMLRSQMNPHFIFNTLNAINSYILESKTEQASDYLVTFSKLVRNILDNSRYESISLDKELTTLELYIQLEQVRLEHSFNYFINIDENVDTVHHRVPPLIIQPFVENALWHGLRNKNENGNIWVCITAKESNTLVIAIIDDGIGRAAANKLKLNQIKHKSYGIDITQSRISLLHADNKIIISDRIQNGNIAGTIVEIYLNN